MTAEFAMPGKKFCGGRVYSGVPLATPGYHLWQFTAKSRFWSRFLRNRVTTSLLVCSDAIFVRHYNFGFFNCTKIEQSLIIRSSSYSRTRSRIRCTSRFTVSEVNTRWTWTRRRKVCCRVRRNCKTLTQRTTNTSSELVETFFRESGDT